MTQPDKTVWPRQRALSVSRDRAAAILWTGFRGIGAGRHLEIGERFARARQSLRALARHPHLAEQIISIGLRGASSAGKFALSLYLLAYVGLADLGVYGLLVAAATAVPAVLGFGLTDWTTRQCVGLPTDEAVSLAGTRIGFTIVVHGVVQPIFWLANAYLGDPIPAHFAILVGPILLLEHLGFDAQGPLIARNRVKLSSIIIFIRSGAWPIAIIAIGWIYPPARSLAWVLAAWLAGLIVMMLVLSGLALRGGRWRMLCVRADWLRDALRRSWPFYLSDIGAVGSLYADRFVISALAGLELTGIYVFFWSAANVVHSVTVYGTFHPRVPALVAAANAGDTATLRKRLFQFQCGTLAWALLLFGLLWIGVQLFLQIGVRPQLNGHLMLFAMIIFAVLLRILADSYHFVLYALCRDRTIAVVNLTLAVGSAVLNALLVSTAGLMGAAVASSLTAAGLLAVRRALSRS
jgi:O-antigen/teichoic acid export membrane protein